MDHWELLQRALERGRAESAALQARRATFDYREMFASHPSSPGVCLSPLSTTWQRGVFGDDRTSNLLRNRGG